MRFPIFSLPSFPHVDIGMVVNAPMLWIILGVFFIAYTTISLVLVYHWIVYGMHSLAIWVAGILFFSVSLLLFSISLSAIHYF